MNMILNRTKAVLEHRNVICRLVRKHSSINTNTQLPASADVVIIGGGSAGCHALYHLAKRGVKAVLLERCKLTSGTTWHTSGLLWRIRMNDVDTNLLARSRNMLLELQKDPENDPGWLQQGGLFIARNKTRLQEYKRLSTVGKALGIENYMLSPEETHTVFPLLNTKIITGAMYSPGDGTMDPTMLCRALSRSAISNGGKIIENCPVNEILTTENILGQKTISGVSTQFGTIKTNCVVNAMGAWGSYLLAPLNAEVPIIPIKHSYVVSQPIDGVKGLPNVRDHDGSIYFRIQGSSIWLGGYEGNPINIDQVDRDFNFGLYELDWSTFDKHWEAAEQLCPTLAKVGIKTNICGPETFSPDHKPILGPDPRCSGLFHSCGFNSAGMMFGGGCGEQLAHWIIHGKPEFHMFAYDVRRFTNEQRKNQAWINQRSHESIARNYSMIFLNDQPLAGRNFKKDPFHQDLINTGAFMEEKQGYERPAFFLTDGSQVEVPPYDYYGNYGYKLNNDSKHIHLLEGDCQYKFSAHHELIGNEAKHCRNKASLFNISYFCKIFLTGPDAKKAIDWICTADMDKPVNSIIYTCALNKSGGVEGDYTVTILQPGNGTPISPSFEGAGYYIVAGGASGHYTRTHIETIVRDKQFNVNVHDVTDNFGILSLQGRDSKKILQKFTEYNLDNLEPYSSELIKIRTATGDVIVRILRISFVGELGYELHIPKDNCSDVYNYLYSIGKSDGLQNAGYRALYSLSCEKGYHLWGYDLRSDDTPIESNLGFTCRKSGDYLGRAVVERQRSGGIHKRLVYLVLDDNKPLWGWEGVYRNGKPVGLVRRGEYAYSLGKPIGRAYIKNPDGEVDDAFTLTGNYQIDVMGKLCSAKCYIKSPFDTKNQRIFGIYV